MIKEKQIKTKDRVKKYGEVFTPENIVKEMLDLTGPMTIEKTFLEPTCGTGNFVVEIYRRKFALCKSKKDIETALKSVVAIDIMADNISECKNRVKDMLKGKYEDKKLDFILNTQIFQGNSLAIMDLLATKHLPINILLPRIG